MHFDTIRTVFAKELREMLRDRRSLMVMFGIPLVLYPLMTLAIASVGANRQQTLKHEDARVALIAGQNAPKLLELLEAPDSGITVIPFADVATFQERKFDATLMVPPGIEKKLLQDPPAATTPTASSPFQPEVHAVTPPLQGVRPVIASGAAADFVISMDLSQSKGPYVEQKLEHIFDQYNAWILQRRLASHNLGKELLTPVTYHIADTATGAQNLGKMLSMIIPLLLLMTGMLGALFPALNATTTERELGTLETLLVTPASRTELLIAKGSLVFLCGLLTAFLNMASMSAVLWRAASAIHAAAGEVHTTFNLDIPALALAYLAAMPAILLFTTAVLIVGLIARNFREANSFATPVMLIPMASVVAIIAELPSTNAFMLTPVLSTTLIIRDLLTGQATLGHYLLAFGSSLVYACLLLSVATRLFTNEQLVNPSWEPLSLKGFGRGAKRPRLPAIDEALAICAASFLLSLYLGGDKLDLTTLSLTEVLFVAAPALLAALIFNYDWRETFSLRGPAALHVLGGILLGLGLIPVALAFQTLQNHFWAPDAGSAGTMENLMNSALRASPIAFPILAGLLAGLCEEILYRGPIQAAFVKRFPVVPGLAITAMLFSLAHLDVHGAPIRALLGLALGWTVYRTRSLVPAIIAHALFDAVQLGVQSWQLQHPEPHAATAAADAFTPTDYAFLAAGIVATGVAFFLLSRNRTESPPAPV